MTDLKLTLLSSPVCCLHTACAGAHARGGWPRGGPQPLPHAGVPHGKVVASMHVGLATAQFTHCGAHVMHACLLLPLQLAWVSVLQKPKGHSCSEPAPVPSRTDPSVATRPERARPAAHAGAPALPEAAAQHPHPRLRPPLFPLRQQGRGRMGACACAGQPPARMGAGAAGAWWWCSGSWGRGRGRWGGRRHACWGWCCSCSCWPGARRQGHLHGGQSAGSAAHGESEYELHFRSP